MTFLFEQSDKEIYASHAGLTVVGAIINRHSGLKKRLRSIPLRHGISHMDLAPTYLGMLCQGKNDFEAVEGAPNDPFFKRSLGISRVPSSARLRQRFDEHAAQLTQAVNDCIAPMLSNLRAPVTGSPSGHVPLNIDVFCLDNSNTRKEGVSRTYHGYDGYAPIGAYLGEEGWRIGLELRPGNQHSRKDFLAFLDRALPQARELGKRRKLLMLLDSGHDAAANRERLSREQADCVIKWNPRHEDPHAWRARAESEGRFIQERPGKRLAVFDERIHWERNNETFKARRAVRVVERTEDRTGQPFLLPQVELEGYWTNLDGKAFPADKLIALYQRGGASEQYHSEFKTDLDLERLPSGKFETNALVLSLAATAYNMLRYIGPNTLIGSDAPVRQAVRRLHTVLQETVYKAVRLIRHGRRYPAPFGRGDPGVVVLAKCYRRVIAL